MLVEEDETIAAEFESWREFISRVAPNHTVTDGMPWMQYAKLQETFGLDAHPELRALLESTNGIKSPLGYDLIWSIERIIEENTRVRLDLRLRKQYMPLDCLFFFADAGNGDYFGHAVVDNQIQCSNVFVWCHDDDSRYVVATSVRRFLEGWLNGTIKLSQHFGRSSLA